MKGGPENDRYIVANKLLRTELDRKSNLRKEVSLILFLFRCVHPVANVMFLAVSLFFRFAMTARLAVAEHVFA